MIPVYQTMKVGGMPVGIREGNVIFDGTGNAPLVCFDGDGIYRGQFSNGTRAFTLIGDRVVAGVNGAVVFTIQGNDIYDGLGGTSFLTCPSGDRMALAGTAVAFMGDMRLRSAGASVVDADSYELEDGDDGGVNHSYYGSRPDPYSDRLAPSDLTDKYGNPEYSNDAFKNLRQQGRAPRGRDNRVHLEDENKNNPGPYKSPSFWNSTPAERGVKAYSSSRIPSKQELKEYEIARTSGNFPGCAIMFAFAIYCYKYFEIMGFGFVYKLFLIYCGYCIIAALYDIIKLEIKWYRIRNRK